MTKNKLSVTQLNNYVKGVFDDELILKNITVYGEVFEKSESGGNVFITLRDEDALLRCVKFGSNFTAEIGDKVSLVGSVEYYAKGNRVSFVFKEYFIEGAGKIRQDFLLLYEKLNGEGVFSNRPTLPVFVRKVGIITSETGAVIHDFLSVVKPACPYVDVCIYPVKVQGDGSAEDIASAITKANFDGRECDVIVVARGGGSNTDLESFNTELVARAVSKSVIPVISAIGHQVDYTLSDFSSSFRAGTPSIAGEKICKINSDFINRVAVYIQSIENKVNALYEDNLNRCALVGTKLENLANGIIYQSKTKLFSLYSRLANGAVIIKKNKQSELHSMAVELRHSVINAVSKEESKLSSLGARLDAISPLKLLSSGYAKVYSADKVIDSVTKINKGDQVEVLFADGSINAIVDSIKSRK